MYVLHEYIFTYIYVHKYMHLYTSIHVCIDPVKNICLPYKCILPHERAQDIPRRALMGLLQSPILGPYEPDCPLRRPAQHALQNT